MNRRQCLSTAAVGAVSSLCGCLSINGVQLFGSGVQVAGVVVQNHREMAETATVRLAAGDSAVHTAELELEPAERGQGYVRTGTEFLDCDWAAESRQYHLDVHAGDEHQSVDLADRADGDCTYVAIQVGQTSGPDLQVQTHDCEQLESGDGVCSFVDSDS